MAGVETRDFAAPDETRTPEKTTVELVNLAGGQIGRYTFQPGWRWSECIFDRLPRTSGTCAVARREPGDLQHFKDATQSRTHPFAVASAS